MNIKYSTTFKKQYKKAPLQIQKKIKERLGVFEENSMHEILNNHMLAGNYQGMRSINITGDWRVIYSIRMSSESEKEYYFELVGKHSQLYR